MADPTSPETTAELTSLFARAPSDTLEPEVLAELQSIMRLHHLEPQDLFFKWESYCIKLDRDDASVSLETVRGLKQDIQDALERSNRAQKPARAVGATPRTSGKGDGFGL
jgi:DNA polymerase alpha subunit B